MWLPVQTPMVGQLATYRGLYCPRSDGGCILVRVPRLRGLMWGSLTLVGLFVAFWVGLIGQVALVMLGVVAVAGVLCGEVECWQPVFEADCDASLDRRGGFIEFEGWVSSRSTLGLKSPHRTVDILRVARHRGTGDGDVGWGRSE